MKLVYGLIFGILVIAIGLAFKILPTSPWSNEKVNSSQE